MVFQASSPDTMSPEKSSVEQVADHLYEERRALRRARSQRRPPCSGLGGLGFDLGPPLLQPIHVGADVVFLDALRAVRMITPASAGTTSRRISLRRCRSVSGNLRLIPGRRRPRHVNQVPPGQRHLCGEARALVPDGILADLDDDVVAWLEGLLDLATGRRRVRRPPS